MSAAGVLVCFDFEAQWGMPFAAPYDLDESAHRILETLARHRARAVFFVVGELALTHPDLIAAIAAGGHELGLHGWRHERLGGLDRMELARLGEALRESAVAIGDITGEQPTGFRAPHLLAPRFHDARVYELLAACGYRWTSNRELRHVVELLRPDRIRTERPWRLAASRPDLMNGPAADLLWLGLNANIYWGSGCSVGAAHRWLRAGTPPFYHGALLEIPLYSPMDCDLLGLPDPAASTPIGLLEYAQFALERCLAQPQPLSMLTFHDWIITGGNRLQLLDSLLSFIAEAGLQTIGVEERWPALAGLADAATAAPTPLPTSGPARSARAPTWV
jgi:peptidoglycan/xylan/chitin deacetylase (PgdA/CDA1 family)